MTISHKLLNSNDIKIIIVMIWSTKYDVNNSSDVSL